MAVTLRDVAQAAGVSTSAVSRAFTPGAPVSATTRTRIVAIADKLGYAPNRLAASLTTGRTRLVGLLAEDSEPLVLALLGPLVRHLAAAGLTPILCPSGVLSSPAAALRHLRPYAPEAAILLAPGLPATFAQGLQRAGLPVTHVFARASNTPQAAQAGVNDTLLGRLACQTLHARGYRDVAVLAGPERSLPTLCRLLGFRQMAERLAMPLRVACAERTDLAAGQSAMEGLLANGPAPEAVFAINDLMALGAIAALASAGLSVPGDVGVIGADDLPGAALPGCNLTTLAQPLDEIAAAAANLTQARIAAPEAPAGAAILPCLLIERGTLRPLPLPGSAGRR